jgi:diaminohydroxyphosphoribosylaminopyrimidine deaminase/5-amino-6-(5-phosphoribosylamino)uracil reductase
MTFSATDHAMMARALRLAERGAYTTRPNPMVGCVLAHGDEIVGEGWHRLAGEPHAEVLALQDAGDRARRHRLTSPSPARIPARPVPAPTRRSRPGVARVVAAMRPVCGRWRRFTRPAAAGIGVERGHEVCAVRSTRLAIAGRARPAVADQAGHEPRWPRLPAATLRISCEASRLDGHPGAPAPARSPAQVKAGRRPTLTDASATTPHRRAAARC